MKRILILLMFCVGAITAHAQALQLLPNGHSHNDYTRQNPLQDALDNGFTSLEIDVYSKKGQIRVSHFPILLGTKPTLDALYLQPLAQRIQTNGGTVYPGDSTQLVLMIDLKKDKAELYTLLRRAFQPYEHLIEVHEGERRRWGPLKLVLSGGPPLDSLRSASKRYFSVDGHRHQWALDLDHGFMPRASTNWRKHFKWKGRGPMPAEERRKLDRMVEEAHARGRKIRFWALPNRPEVWKVVHEAGVDWINVDNLAEYRDFYLSQIRP
ncbi:MAG: hypothetical protein AAF570_27995 [Bacteroidota bacterium]